MAKGSRSSIPDEKDQQGYSPENYRQGKTRRKGFSYTGAVERFIDDAENEKFPIKFRKQDCERVNSLAQMLNILHQRGDVEQLRLYIAQLAIMAADHEKMNK